ncbi:hypothetical protein D3C75_1115030 [compost metagenome]
MRPRCVCGKRLPRLSGAYRLCILHTDDRIDYRVNLAGRVSPMVGSRSSACRKRQCSAALEHGKLFDSNCHRHPGTGRNVGVVAVGGSKIDLQQLFVLILVEMLGFIPDFPGIACILRYLVHHCRIDFSCFVISTIYKPVQKP